MLGGRPAEVAFVQHVEIEKRIAAPRQRTFDTYADHVGWGDWGGLGRVELEREGSPAPNGVGCVRVITTFGLSVWEEVRSFEPPKHMTYSVLKGGLPFREHLGEVHFEEDGDGTRIVWRCRFEPAIPGMGPIFRRIVESVFRRVLDGLERRLRLTARARSAAR